MPILHIEHRVRDYESWKRAFDSDPVGRERGGVRSYRVLRAADDPNDVMIELEFDDRRAADAFHAKLRELWGRVGSELGLEGPQARVVEAVDDGTYERSSQPAR